MALGKSHFWLILVRAYGLKREREKIRKQEEEEGRKKDEGKEEEVQVWKLFVYGIYICLELVWNLYGLCMETICVRKL